MPRKSIVKKTNRTEVNIETGELRHIVTENQIGVVETEPDYIKIYINTQLCLNNLDPSLAPYIIAFGPHMTYANDEHYKHMVMTNEFVREDVAKTLGVTPKRVEQIITKLIENGIFIPIYKETEQNGIIKQTKKRGFYFVNPWVVAKGKWSDIKQLQQNIDFVRGVSSYVITDSIGTQKIQCKLPEKIYNQMRIEDFYNEN